MNNPFWEYSLSHYAIAGVEPLCIALQDEYGLDVNLLLYAAWLASLGQRLEDGHLLAVDAAVAQWRQQVLVPLRLLRRQWPDCPQAGDLREELKALELKAERRQQDIISRHYNATPQLPGQPGALHANLACVARSLGQPTAGWEPGIGRLAALLGG